MQVFQTLCTVGFKSFIMSYIFLIHCFTLYAHLFAATCSLGQLLFELLVQTPLSSFVPASILLLLSHSSPPLNHTPGCPQVLQQHSDNPFNHSCPTILFYTASTAGFRRYIVCIPIYPYSLISILFSSISVHLQFYIFVDNIPFTPSPVSLSFYHVFISIDFLVFFLYFTQGFSSAPHLHKRSLCDDTTRRPRGRAHPFARVDSSAPFIVCFQQHQPHAGTINLVTTSIIMLFDSTAGRMRMRLHSRWKA